MKRYWRIQLNKLVVTFFDFILCVSCAQATTTVYVSAGTSSVDTGIYLQEGDSITITATGQMSPHNGDDWCSPDGATTSLDFHPLPTIPAYALVGAIGGPPFNNPAHGFPPGGVLLGDGGFIGSNFQGVAPASGNLYLAINDYPLYDNLGGYTADISVNAPVKVLTVKTEPADPIGQTSATLWGLIEDDGGEGCQYKFRYRKAGDLICRETSWTGSVTTGQTFSESITGLTSGSKYYFNAKAKNSAGESDWGNEQSFTTGTAVQVPTVSTQSATNIGQTSATLRGSVVNDGGQACQYRFRYWKSGGSYSYTTWTGSVTTGQSFSQTVTGLTSDSTYYFNAKAKNSAGESNWGNEVSFTTPLPPVYLAITEIRSAHCSPTKHTYYLNDVSLNERFTVTIDWKGSPPGKIKWITPTGTYEDTCSGTTASRTFDMGTDFGVDGKLSAIAIVAGGSLQSAPRQANFDIIPPPSGIPATLLKPEKSGGPISYSAEWILNAINEGIEENIIPSDIPGFGSRAFEFVVKPLLKAKITGDGIARATIFEGYELPSFDIASVEMEPKATVQLGWQYSSQQKKWIPSGYIEVSVEGSYTSPPSYYVILVGPIPVPIYWRCGLDVALAVQLALGGWTTNDNPIWQGIIPFEIGAEIMLGVGLADVLAAEGYLGGSANMLLEFPNEDPLQELCIELNGGIRIYLLIWRYENPLLHYEWCLIGAENLYSTTPLFDFGASAYEFELMDRDYIGPNYAVWVPAATKRQDDNLMLYEALIPSEPNEEQLLQYNVFGQSQPTLATDGNDLLMAWVYDDPNRTSVNRTKILFSKCYNNTWSQPTAIDDDGTADFSPQLAVLPGSDVLCVWENINQQLPDNANLTDMVETMDIVAAHYDSYSGLWTTHFLTNNEHLDRTPRIASADNDTAIAVWVHNEKDDILGLDPSALHEIYYSKWDGTNWTEPNVVAAGIGLIVKTALAYNGNQAIYVYTLDGDYNWQTDSDQELYAITYDGTKWSQPNRLTNDTLLDANPQALYDQNDLLLVWYRDADFVSCHNLDMNDVQQLLRTTGSSGAMDFRLAKSPTGQISLLWTDTSANGVDIFTATYDQRFSLWSNIYQLTSDSNMEKSLAVAYGDFDELVAVYNKVNIIYDNSIPESNRVDLYLLRHRIKNDLEVTSSDISLSVPNPIPGTTVSIDAVIHNSGDFVEVNVPVAFYNGDPKTDGVLIGSTQIVPGPILAAGNTTASVSWLVPHVNEPQQIYVVIDPSSTMEDANRNNNIATISVLAPDLAIDHITSEKTGPRLRTVTTRIANSGVLPVHNASVIIRSDSVTGPQLATFDIAKLDPNSFYDVSFDWDLTAAALNSIEVLLYVIVDEPNNINESDETNNIAFGLIRIEEVADVTAADKIDFTDLFHLAEIDCMIPGYRKRHLVTQRAIRLNAG